MRSRNEMAWLRSPGTAASQPRSRARRSASMTGPGSPSPACRRPSGTPQPFRGPPRNRSWWGRAQRGGDDAAVAGFLPQRLAEGQRECFGRAVGGLVGGGLERDGGRDVQHATASALDHARQDSPGDLNQSSDVNGDDVHCPAAVASVEGAVGSEAGVVDQQIEGPVTEFAQQGQNAVAGGKAGRDQGDRAVAGTGGDALADLLESARVTAGLLRRFGRLRCARTKRSVRPFIRA